MGNHRGRTRHRCLIASATAAIALALAPTHPLTAEAAATRATFAAAVAAIEQLPYQPDYVPVGTDSAFPSGLVVNTPPVDDYTGGSIANSSTMPNASYDPSGVGGAPPWPSTFTPRTVRTADGATLTGWYHAVPGSHPGILVVHGFNTHGAWSVVRWAAMLAADGYNVAAFDQRDFSDNTDPTHPQSFGWKESEDVLAAGHWLAAQPGVTSVGVVGFSEGAQNTVLAMSLDSSHVFSAGLTFSAPADQDTQIWGSRQPASCTSSCQYPATDALVALVVPSPTGAPYTDVCAALGDAAKAYHTTGFEMLTRESALHAQAAIGVPLLNFYSADDSLVDPVMASYMAAYEGGRPLQRTLEVSRGEHAYFFDRWWQQQAILRYFKAMLPSGADVTTAATVNQTPGGVAFASQEVAILQQTRAATDAAMGPYVCDTGQGSPGQVAARRLQPASPSPGTPAGSTRGGATAQAGLANTAGPPPSQAPIGVAALLTGVGAAAARRRRSRGG